MTTRSRRRSPVEAAGVLAGVIAILCLVLEPALAATTRNGVVPFSNLRITDATGAREVHLQINKSLIVELPQDTKDILVANPNIANAIVRSARRVFMIGTGIGSTNIFFFDANGGQIAAIDLVVDRDLDGLNRMLKRLFPNTDIKAEGIGENVIVSGQVNSATDAKTAIEIAERFVGQLSSSAATNSTGSSNNGASTTSITIGSGQVGSGGTRIINALTIMGKEQVQLHVVVAEMNRKIVKQLGVDLNGTWTFGPSTFTFNQVNPFILNSNLASSVASGANGVLALPGKLNTNITLKTLEQAGLVRTLAEPNLTAISGEQATFLAGGEFPVPVARDRDGNITLEYKQFGVGLSFIPVVLSEGRISIRAKTEVSEIDFNNGFTNNNTNIPGLQVRRAESTLEMPSGGTMVLAGMISDQTKKAVNGIPGLRKLPILGNLFSSQDFLSNQTELVIIVTPYIVNPVARSEVSLPTDGFVNASDPEALLLGRFNHVYGVRGQPAPTDRPRGRFGFVYE